MIMASRRAVRLPGVQVGAYEPHGTGYWSAYQAAKRCSVPQIEAILDRAEQELAEAEALVSRFQGRVAGWRDALAERRG
jgi:hypothetical protein